MPGRPKRALGGRGEPLTDDGIRGLAVIDEAGGGRYLQLAREALVVAEEAAADVRRLIRSRDAEERRSLRDSAMAFSLALGQVRAVAEDVYRMSTMASSAQQLLSPESIAELEAELARMKAQYASEQGAIDVTSQSPLGP